MVVHKEVLRAIFKSAEIRDASRRAALLVADPELPEPNDGIYPDFGDAPPRGKHFSGHKTSRAVNRKRASRRSMEKKTRRKNR